MATVNLLNAKDSSFVVGDISDLKGNFNLKAPKGNYIVKVFYLGYKPFYQTVSTTGSTSNVVMGKLPLITDEYLLKEAVVVGKAAEIVVKNDTVEYNASSYKTEENAVVEDLLKKLPGVDVDKEGKITVNGKEVKRFLVDGKEFFSQDPQTVSKNLPAEMIEKLQVLDKKSEMAQLTGFNDNEEETVINLTIKPGMKQGTLGNAMAGLGRDLEKDNDTRYEAAALLNYMRNNDRLTLMIGGNNTNNMGAADLGAQQFGGGGRGLWRGSGGLVESQRATLNMNKQFSPKLSLNGDVMFNSSDRNSISDVEETTIAKTQTQLDKTYTKNKNISDNFFTNFRIEWNPDSANTFIFRPAFGYNKSSNDQEEFSDRFNYNTGDTIFRTISNSQSEGSGYNFQLNVDYAHKFSKPGRIFSVSARGRYNDSYSYENSDWLQQNYTDNVYTGNTIRNQRLENDGNSTNLRGFVSYVEPLGRNNFLQATYRISQIITDDINSTYNLSDRHLNPTPNDTATMYGNQSRSTERNSIEQRFSLNFKSIRQKYNYTIGLNIDPTSSNNRTYQPDRDQLITEIIPYPYDGRLPNIKGNSLISEIKQNVINLSPDLNFNYLFDKRTNLRFDYSGSTNQPSANQLRDFVDESNPNNLVKGNPDLKPGYSNEFRLRFNKSIPESQLFYNFNLDGDFSFNDITSVSTLFDNGVRMTTYQNVNGNWNLRFRGMFNTPLKKFKKITIGNFLFSNVGNYKTFTNGVENTRKSVSVTDRLNVNYRSELFDVGVNGSISYSNITYEINRENNQNTYNWGVGGYTTWYLPHKFTLDSDINWTARSGYAEGFNISETMWNASLSKQLFNKKIGTGTLKLKIYDILQNRNSISGSSTTSGFRTTRTNVIPSFFMCTFIYKFSIFPGGSTATEQDVRGSRRSWGGPDDGGRRF